MITPTRRVGRLAMAFVAALALAGSAIGCPGEGSTPDLCDQACTHWAACDPANTGYDWSYDACYDSCISEGDWTQGYVDCVLSETYCTDIEQC